MTSCLSVSLGKPKIQNYGVQTEKWGWLVTLLKDYLFYKIFYHKIASNGQLQKNIKNIVYFWFIVNSLEYVCLNNLLSCSARIQETYSPRFSKAAFKPGQYTYILILIATI